MDNSQQEHCTSEQLLEKEVLDSLPKVLHSEMTLVDINANKGEWVFHSSRIIKKGIIYAIEPDSNNFKELKSNCQRWPILFDNNVSMYPMPIAISDRSTATGPVITDSSTKQNEETLDVNLKSYDLDTLFEPINPDLIKIMNVKGKESRIIKGARNILQKGKTKFLIQVDEWADTDGQNSLPELCNFMKSFGYQPKNIHVWLLFVNRRKSLFYRIKKIGRRLLIG